MLDVKDWLWIKDLHTHGWNLSQISEKTGFDRKTIQKYVKSTSEPEPKKRRLPASCIFSEIQEMGFTGKYTIVREYIRTVRLSQEIPANQFRCD